MQRSKLSTSIRFTIIFIFFLSFLVKAVEAETTIQYYQSLKEQWRLENYNIEIASDYNNESTNSNTLIICNTVSNLELKIRNDSVIACNKTGITSGDTENLIVLNGPEWYPNDIVMAEANDTVYSTIIIPEIYILTPDLQAKLSKYFMARNQSTSNFRDIEPSKILAVNEIKELWKYLALIIPLILSVAIIGLISKRSVLNDVFQKLAYAHIIIKPFSLSLLFLYLGFLFLLLLSIIGLYFASQLSETLNGFIQTIYENRTAEIILTVLSLFIGGFILALYTFSDAIFNLLKSKLYLLKKPNINPSELTNSFAIVCFLFISTMWLVPGITGLIIATDLGLLLMLLIWKISSQRTPLKTQQYVFILFFTILISMYGAYKTLNEVRETYRFIGVFDKQNMIILPHRLNMPVTTLLKNIAISPSFPVFANEYLIYDPSDLNRKIRHRKLSNNLPKNGYIVITDVYKFISEAAFSYGENDFDKIIVSKQNSEYFKFDQPRNLNNLMYFTVDRSCRYPGSFGISIESTKDGNTNSTSAISIPECEPSAENERHVAAINPNNYSNDFIYKLSIKDSKKMALVNYTFSTDDTQITVSKFRLTDDFLKIGEHMVLKTQSDPDTINVYIQEEGDIYEGEMTSGDFIQNINTLLEGSHLQREVTLSSMQKNAILYESE